MSDLAEEIRALVDGAVPPATGAQVRSGGRRRHPRRRVVLVVAIAGGIVALGTRVLFDPGDRRGDATVLSGSPATGGDALAGADLYSVAVVPPSETASLGTPLGIGPVRTNDAHDELVLYVGSHVGATGCDATVTATIDRSQEQDRIQLYSRQNPGADTTACRPDLPVTFGRLRLPAPLRSLSITDGATGRSVAVIDGRTLLRPSSLPAGWRELRESGTGSEWNRAFGIETPDAVRVSVSVDQGARLMRLGEAGSWRVIRPVTVGGHPAELIELPSPGVPSGSRGVLWREGDELVLVHREDAGMFTPAASETEAILLDFAGRLVRYDPMG